MLSHQGTKDHHTFPGFLFAGGDSFQRWAQTQKGAKVPRNRETITFTRGELERKQHKLEVIDVSLVLQICLLLFIFLISTSHRH